MFDDFDTQIQCEEAYAEYNWEELEDDDTEGNGSTMS